jgi:uncharacterized protein with NRDE domain
MCTLIVMHRQVPGVPLVVAANRDEYLDRPATPPALWEHPNGSTILAPRDLRAGGTWLGLNSNNVFSALTNRPVQTPDTTRRSRGHLVLDALGHSTAGKAAAAFESLRSDQYNPFNLLIADLKEAFTVVCYDGVVRVGRLEPGVHVIGNAEPNDIDHPKTNRVRNAARENSDHPDDVLTGLAELCRSHDGTDITSGSSPPSPLGATCVHVEGYGTRSSILLRLSEDPKQSKLLHADGAPCVHPYENSTPLLHELSRMASYTGVGSPSTVRTAS